jgi:hypothetical protein
MCTQDIIEISTLNEYIQTIKEKKLNDYYFRGENQKYPTISSSLLRKDTSVLLKQGEFSFYEDIVNHYYSEIASNIGELERKNFLAFSQHHGLATNLIDFTTSPLIALYFACAARDISEKNRGFVYLVSKDNTIDISRIMNEEFESPAHSYNLIEKFVGNKKFFRTFSAYLNDFFCKNGFEPHKGILIEQSIHLFLIANGYTQTFLEEYIEITKNITDTSKLFEDLPSLLSKHLSRYDVSIEGIPLLTCIYIILLTEYFQTLSSLSFFNNKEATIEFPEMPYLIYRTPYKFDRIRNQDGIFLYQLFHTYATVNEDVPNSIVRQKVTPDITIIVKNQKEILEELDFIGINLKSIYGDFDNTASYINNKFF